MALSHQVDKVPFHIRIMPRQVRTALKHEAITQGTSMERLAIRYIVDGIAIDNGIKKGGK